MCWAFYCGYYMLLLILESVFIHCAHNWFSLCIRFATCHEQRRFQVVFASMRHAHVCTYRLLTIVHSFIHCVCVFPVNSVAWAPHEFGLMLACGSSDCTISIISSDGKYLSCRSVVHLRCYKWMPFIFLSSNIQLYTDYGTSSVWIYSSGFIPMLSNQQWLKKVQYIRVL